MEKKALPYSTNDRIEHPSYGPGSIVEMNDLHTTIDFDEAGIKKFMTSMVALSSSSTSAPARQVKKRKKKKPPKDSPPEKVK